MSDEPLTRRLLQNVMLDDHDCWLWQGYVSKEGYGYVRAFQRTMRAHRAAWAAFVGPIPTHLQVNHRCHVRRCINPEHLYLGTQKQNMADARAIGTFQNAKPNQGEASNLSRLDEATVREIRARGHESHRLLAQEFGVHSETIRRIVRRETWAHV